MKLTPIVLGVLLATCSGERGDVDRASAAEAEIEGVIGSGEAELAETAALETGFVEAELVEAGASTETTFEAEMAASTSIVGELETGVAAVGTTAESGAETEAADALLPQPSRQEVSDLAQRLVAYWPLAAMSRENDENYFGFGIGLDAGAIDFTQRHIVRAYTLGYRRVCLHLPLGKQTHTDGRMGVDAPDDLEEVGREAIVADWVAALRWLNRRHPDLEVIVYLGSHDKDSATALEEGRYWEHFDRMWRGVRPFLDMPNVSIVFDSAVGWPEDHPFSRVVQLCRYYKDRQGRSVGVEASPQRANPWARDYTVWVLEGTWRRQRHERNFARDELPGEVMSVLDGHPFTKEFVQNRLGGNWFRAAAQIHRDDRTPVIQIWGGEFKEMSAADAATRILRTRP